MFIVWLCSKNTPEAAQIDYIWIANYAKQQGLKKAPNRSQIYAVFVSLLEWNI